MTTHFFGLVWITLECGPPFKICWISPCSLRFRVNNFRTLGQLTVPQSQVGSKLAERLDIELIFFDLPIHCSIVYTHLPQYLFMSCPKPSKNCQIFFLDLHIGLTTSNTSSCPNQDNLYEIMEPLFNMRGV